MENNNDQEQDMLLKKIKDFFLTQFIPVTSFNPDVLLLSTNDIYERLLRLYPRPDMYNQADVAQWLEEAGFCFTDTTGDLKLEWMLQKK